MPLKSYKYQSVDKSYISNYILRHYVLRPLFLPHTVRSRSDGKIVILVECICRDSSAMDCSQHGHAIGLPVHSRKCDAHRAVYARSHRTGTHCSSTKESTHGSLTHCPRVLPGCTIVSLLACGCKSTRHAVCCSRKYLIE